MRNLFITAWFVASLFPAASAMAQNEKEGIWTDETTLDGQVFKKDQLNQAFLDAVFTKDVLNERADGLILAEQHDLPEKSIVSPKNIKAGFPWIYPHLYPADNLPRLMAVNKWVTSPRISFGMPNNLKPFQKTSSSDEFYITDKHSSEYSEASENATFLSAVRNTEQLLPQLSETTGLNIKYLPNEEETTQNYAEIRVNLIPRPDNTEYIYKKNLLRDVITSSWGRTMVSFPFSVEDKIKTGFVYTAASKKQVDGYFLSNSRNEIVMAVCYIWQGHNARMLKSLINECLIRSLGLPGGIRKPGGMQNPIANTYLTYWNDLEKFPDTLRSKIRQPDNISEFDQHMLKTLYNPALKSGTDYISAQKIISGSN